MLIYVDFDSMLAIVCKGWQFRSPVTPGRELTTRHSWMRRIFARRSSSPVSSSSARGRLVC